MIVLVDDEANLLDMLKYLLEKDGIESKSFTSAKKALIWLETAPTPNLIVSDIVMDGINGFEFRHKVASMPTMKDVPFFFMSSLSDEETIVKGLDVGADLYIEKPIMPKIFRAKVRAILRRHPGATPDFVGDLGKLPFHQLFQFCEEKKLSGEVTISHKDFSAKLNFVGGELDTHSNPEIDDVLDKVYGLNGGVFSILQHSANFEEIRSSQMINSAETKKELSEKPMGMLSGVQIGKKLVQVQTEYVSTPVSAVVTIVVYNGKTIHKKSEKELPDFTKDGVEAVIKHQHLGVEAHIRGKLFSASQHEEPEKQKPEDFNTLLAEGMKHCAVADYQSALEVWTRAKVIDPNNNLLQINMKILLRKMGKLK